MMLKTLSSVVLSSKKLYFNRASYSMYLSIVLSLAVSSIYACQEPEQKRDKSNTEPTANKNIRKKPSKRTPVEVERVKRGKISDRITAVAVVRAKERASVRSLISGLVSEVYVEEGAEVKAKQKLAKLSRPGANRLIQKAQSAYQKARRDVSRLSSLVKRGLAPREELSQAKFNRDQSRLELTRLRDEAKNETLRSPINGVITSRAIYRGEAVSPGQLLFDVMDLTKLYVPLQLPDRWAIKVRTGMKAKLFDRSGEVIPIEAEVSYVGPVIDADTGTFTAWVSPKGTAIDSQIPERLKPGLFVSVEITIDERPAALLIPRDAVVYKDGEPIVTKVLEDRAEHISVALGYREDEQVEVLSPLREGDLVVTFGQRGLDNGAEVRVIDRPQTESTDGITGSEPNELRDRLKR